MEGSVERRASRDVARSTPDLFTLSIRGGILPRFRHS